MIIHKDIIPAACHIFIPRYIIRDTKTISDFLRSKIINHHISTIRHFSNADEWLAYKLHDMKKLFNLIKTFKSKYFFKFCNVVF
ncbi:hypothetical protein CNY67_12970 [Desulfovibrio sp. G11]|nr:hypothetical protein CNY67_12970 [Desulfovibrio sp. G11]